MPVSFRYTRIAAASIIIFIFYFLYTHQINWNVAHRTPENSSGLPKIAWTEEPLSNSAQPASEVPLGYVRDAHKLPDADAFLPHFKAITRLPSMTMEEAKSGCTWPDISAVNFQYSAADEWTKIDRPDSELEMRRTQWHDFIASHLLPYETYKDRFSGRGIIIVAGNQKSMMRVKIILQQLKRLDSKMPIEIHYWDTEMTEASKKDIASMWQHKMYFNDLSLPTNILKTNHDGFYINYQLKTAAIINSRFAEPLLLDSDNIPILAPESLYESSVYKEFGTIFWPDIARTRPNNPMWAITNTKCAMDEYEQESGQLLVDKRRYFYHLQLAAWLNNEHAEYYNEFLLGDKDMFRFAWHALKTAHGKPSKWLTSVGTVTDGGYYCGHSFAQYSPNGSVAFLHGGLIKAMQKEVMKWHRESRGGIFQVYKRSQYEELHGINVGVGIKFDGADYLPNKPEALGVGQCTDLKDVVARPLDELLPGFEKTFEEIGGYWMLED